MDSDSSPVSLGGSVRGSQGSSSSSHNSSSSSSCSSENSVSPSHSRSGASSPPRGGCVAAAGDSSHESESSPVVRDAQLAEDVDFEADPLEGVTQWQTHWDKKGHRDWNMWTADEGDEDELSAGDRAALDEFIQYHGQSK